MFCLRKAPLNALKNCPFAPWWGPVWACHRSIVCASLRQPYPYRSPISSFMMHQFHPWLCRVYFVIDAKTLVNNSRWIIYTLSSWEHAIAERKIIVLNISASNSSIIAPSSSSLLKHSKPWKHLFQPIPTILRENSYKEYNKCGYCDCIRPK